MKARRDTLKRLRDERRRLLRQLSSLSLVIRGSFFKRFSTCSRPDCACHEGKRHGPRFYVVITQDKAQRQHYVSNQQVPMVRRGIQQYWRLLEIIDRITTINIDLIRGGYGDE
jgi:hypothetical protein